MPYYAGKFATLTIGGVAYPMDSWSLDQTMEEVAVTNVTSGGGRQVIAGIAGGSMSASGPYSGASPTVGATGTVIFDVGGGSTASKTILLTSVKTATAVKDKATLDVSGSITY